MRHGYALRLIWNISSQIGFGLSVRSTEDIGIPSYTIRSQTIVFSANILDILMSTVQLDHAFAPPAPPAPPVVVPSLFQPTPPTVTTTNGAKNGKGNVTFVEPRKQWVPVSIVPHMLHTTPIVAVTESASPSTDHIGVPPVVLLGAESTPEVPPIVHENTPGFLFRLRQLIP